MEVTIPILLLAAGALIISGLRSAWRMEIKPSKRTKAQVIKERAKSASASEGKPKAWAAVA